MHIYIFNDSQVSKSFGTVCNCMNECDISQIENKQIETKLLETEIRGSLLSNW